MSFYPTKIQERITSKRTTEVLSIANAVATEASFVCGSFVSFSMVINEANAEIVEISYRTNGCGYLIASCEVLKQWLIYRRLTNLHGVGKGAIVATVTDELGAFPPGRTHCVELTVDALRAVFAGYRIKLLDEYDGETALICTCFGIAEDSLEKCINEHRLTNVSDVIERCRAGGGCGSCQPLIQELIDAAFSSPRGPCPGLTYGD